MNMKNSKWQDDFSPIDEDSPATTSRQHSKAYLRHLFKTEELLAAQIATLHNLSFFLSLSRRARQNIIDGTFTPWKDAMLPKLSQKALMKILDIYIIKNICYIFLYNVTHR